MAPKKKDSKKKDTAPHGVRCSQEMSNEVDAVRAKFGVDRSDVWRWAMSVALRELKAGRVTGPGELGVPAKDEVTHVAA